MSDPNYTALLIILDRSGSMSDIRDDMVGGLEQMLKQQAERPGMLTVDIVTFDSVIEHTHGFASPGDITIELVPRGSTALHDAMGLSINLFGQALAALPAHAQPSAVQVFVVTDGMENASHEYTAKMVRGLVESRSSADGWDFVFLGAGQDAVLTAQDLGIRPDKSMSYSKRGHNVESLITAMGTQVSNARDRLMDVGFTEAERDAALRGDNTGEDAE